MERAHRILRSRLQLGGGAAPLQRPRENARVRMEASAVCFSIVNDTEEDVYVAVTRPEDAASLRSTLPPGRCTFITEPVGFEESRAQLLELGGQRFELRFTENNGYHFLEVSDPELAVSTGERYAIVQEEPRQILHGATYLRCHVVRPYDRRAEER